MAVLILALAACGDTVEPATTEAAAPVTTVTAPTEERLVVIDWEAAARTSAEGLDVEIAPLRLTYLVPSSGWSVYPEGWAVTRSSGMPPRGAGITFERPLAIYADRCVWDDPDGLIVVGSTIDDLVDALVANPEYAATNVRDVVVDGFRGKQFDMIGMPPDLDTGRCSAGVHPDGRRASHVHRPWAGRYGMGVGELNRVRVLDVDGQRVVMRAVWFPGTPEEDLAVLWSIFESLRIERLPER